MAQTLLQFKNSYLSYCSVNTSSYGNPALFLEPYQAILNSLEDAYQAQSTTISVSLANQGLNEQTLIPIIKTIQAYPKMLQGLDVSQSPYFKDSSLKMLLGVIEQETNLTYLNLEKTGITDSSALQLINLLPKAQLQVLNLSSIAVSAKFFEGLTKLIYQRSLQHLLELDISNNKMTDAQAKELLTAIFFPHQNQTEQRSAKNETSKRSITSRKSSLVQQYLSDMDYRCPIESLNLSRNCLGFKTGAFIMSMLVQANVKTSTKLMRIDLQYNTISLLVQNSVKKLLTETSYFLQQKMAAEQNDRKSNLSLNRGGTNNMSGFLQSNLQSMAELLQSNGKQQRSLLHSMSKLGRSISRDKNLNVSYQNAYDLHNQSRMSSQLTPQRDSIIRNKNCKLSNFGNQQRNSGKKQSHRSPQDNEVSKDEMDDVVMSQRDLPCNVLSTQKKSTRTSRAQQSNLKKTQQSEDLATLSFDDTTSKLEERLKSLQLKNFQSKNMELKNRDSSNTNQPASDYNQQRASYLAHQSARRNLSMAILNKERSLSKGSVDDDSDPKMSAVLTSYFLRAQQVSRDNLSKGQLSSINQAPITPQTAPSFEKNKIIVSNNHLKQQNSRQNAMLNQHPNSLLNTSQDGQSLNNSKFQHPFYQNLNKRASTSTLHHPSIIDGYNNITLENPYSEINKNQQSHKSLFQDRLTQFSENLNNNNNPPSAQRSSNSKFVSLATNQSKDFKPFSEMLQAQQLHQSNPNSRVQAQQMLDDQRQRSYEQLKQQFVQGLSMENSERHSPEKFHQLIDAQSQLGASNYKSARVGGFSDDKNFHAMEGGEHIESNQKQNHCKPIPTHAYNETSHFMLSPLINPILSDDQATTRIISGEQNTKLQTLEQLPQEILQDSANQIYQIGLDYLKHPMNAALNEQSNQQSNDHDERMEFNILREDG